MDVEELVRVRETLERLAHDGVDGLTGAQTEVVALEARRLRELADHAEGTSAATRVAPASFGGRRRRVDGRGRRSR